MWDSLEANAVKFGLDKFVVEFTCCVLADRHRTTASRAKALAQPRNFRLRR
jgi:hypothetical protein